MKKSIIVLGAALCLTISAWANDAAHSATSPENSRTSEENPVPAIEDIYLESFQEWIVLAGYGGTNFASRAISISEKNDDTLLAFDFYSDSCAYPAIKIIGGNPDQNTWDTEKIGVQIRVDEKTIFKVPALYSFEGENIVVYLDTDYDTNLISEAKHGGQIRFKLEINNEVFYGRYSLWGISAAYSRAQAICRQALVN